MISSTWYSRRKDSTLLTLQAHGKCVARSMCCKEQALQGAGRFESDNGGNYMELR